MVSGVSGSTGVAAYLKSTQSGSGSGAPAVKGDAAFGRDTNVEAPKKAPEIVRSTDSSQSFTKASTSDLETRNEEQTIDTELARGSLLDIAV